MKSTFQDILQQHTANCVRTPAEMKEKAHHKHDTELFSLWENFTMKMISSSRINSVKPVIDWAMLRKYKGH